MTRSLPALAVASLLLVACSSSKPVAQQQQPVDPVTDPTVIASVSEAAMQGSIESQEAVAKVRRAAVVAGVIAAVAGGPKVDTPEGIVDRYFHAHDAVEATAATIGLAKGATAGAKRGFELDQQFAELHKLEGVDVIRPVPDEILARFSTSPTPELLANIASVFANREQRNVDIEAPGDVASHIGDELTALGVKGIETHRNDDLAVTVLRIHFHG